jgi:hypothetical protein
MHVSLELVLWYHTLSDFNAAASIVFHGNFLIVVPGTPALEPLTRRVVGMEQSCDHGDLGRRSCRRASARP